MWEVEFTVFVHIMGVTLTRQHDVHHFDTEADAKTAMVELARTASAVGKWRYVDRTKRELVSAAPDRPDRHVEITCREWRPPQVRPNALKDLREAHSWARYPDIEEPPPPPEDRIREDGKSEDGVAKDGPAKKKPKVLKKIKIDQ